MLICREERRRGRPADSGLGHAVQSPARVQSQQGADNRVGWCRAPLLPYKALGPSVKTERHLGVDERRLPGRAARQIADPPVSRYRSDIPAPRRS